MFNYTEYLKSDILALNYLTQGTIDVINARTAWWARIVKFVWS